MTLDMLCDPVPAGRVARGLSFGGHRVDVVIERLDDAGETASTAGRRLAEELAAACLHLPRGGVRVAALAPSGRPVAVVGGRPVDVAVTISHAAGVVAAAAAVSAPIGIDIVDPAEAGRGLDLWFTPDELSLAPDDDGLLRGQLWAAKEAAYKAARLDTEFRLGTVSIDALSPRGFAWSARSAWRGARGEGRFVRVGRLIVAVAIHQQHEEVPS
jgi:4'-phosphopantetheinyl transferase EntD